jgi:hypothetical protein
VMGTGGWLMVDWWWIDGGLMVDWWRTNGGLMAVPRGRSFWPFFFRMSKAFVASILLSLDEKNGKFVFYRLWGMNNLKKCTLVRLAKKIPVFRDLVWRIGPRSTQSV